MNYISSYKGWRWTALFISDDRRRRLLFMLSAVAAAAWLSGCAIQDVSPIVREPQRIQLSQSGELEVHTHAMPPVGDVLPVQVSVRNLAPRARVIETVQGITDSGEHVDELGLQDPVVVNNAAELFHIASGGQSALGAVVERMGGWLPASVIGVQVLGAGFVGIGAAAAWEAAKSPQERLGCYRLGGRLLPEEGTTIGLNKEGTDVLAGGRNPRGIFDSNQSYIDSCGRNPGFVFLPNRSYTAIEVAVRNTLTSNVEVLTVPWISAADIAEQHREGSSR